MPAPVPALRASMRPSCSSIRRRASVSPIPRPLRARLSTLFDLHEHVEDAGEQRRLDPDAGVADLDDGFIDIHRRGHRDAPAAVGVLHGVVQQVGERLRQPREVGVDPQAANRADRPPSTWPAATLSGSIVSMALRTTVRRSIRSRRSSIRLRVIRDTSSRSSVSRTSCCSCRSMIASARSFNDSSCPGPSHQFERIANRRQRIAQLVRQRRQELVLPPIGLAQHFLERACRSVMSTHTLTQPQTRPCRS